MIVNPVAPFYEFFLTLYNSLPGPFKAFFGLVWGFIIIFSIFSALSKL